MGDSLYLRNNLPCGWVRAPLLYSFLKSLFPHSLDTIDLSTLLALWLDCVAIILIVEETPYDSGVLAGDPTTRVIIEVSPSFRTRDPPKVRYSLLTNAGPYFAIISFPIFPSPPEHNLQAGGPGTPSFYIKVLHFVNSVNMLDGVKFLRNSIAATGHGEPKHVVTRNNGCQEFSRSGLIWGD